jgi:hypothetical protein
MVAVLVFAAVAVGVVVGLIFGFGVGTNRTAAALKLARYRDAIGLADDLVKTPDALDLRERAQKILAAHRAANPSKES